MTDSLELEVKRTSFGLKVDLPTVDETMIYYGAARFNTDPRGEMRIISLKVRKGGNVPEPLQIYCTRDEDGAQWSAYYTPLDDRKAPFGSANVFRPQDTEYQALEKLLEASQQAQR